MLLRAPCDEERPVQGIAPPPSPSPLYGWGSKPDVGTPWRLETTPPHISGQAATALITSYLSDEQAFTSRRCLNHDFEAITPLPFGEWDATDRTCAEI